MNRIKQYEIPRAVDSLPPSDTGYGSGAAFIASRSEAERDAGVYSEGYWNGVADERERAGNVVPIDAGGVGLLWCILWAGLALWGVVIFVNWLVGW